MFWKVLVMRLAAEMFPQWQDLEAFGEVEPCLVDYAAGEFPSRLTETVKLTDAADFAGQLEQGCFSFDVMGGPIFERWPELQFAWCKANGPLRGPTLNFANSTIYLGTSALS